MSRRATGWTLLALAVAGAVGVGALGVREGRVDVALLVVVAVGVVGATVAVLLDRRSAARRPQEVPARDGALTER
ncbi:MAG: hypothetical protein H5T83_10240 [Actinotalea sp.]|nr:hypothetical protein [Actinotalea sp.]